MIRTTNAAKKSAKAIASGTVLSAIYSVATGQDVHGSLMMGVAAMVGICTYLFFYQMEQTQK